MSLSRFSHSEKFASKVPDMTQKDAFNYICLYMFSETCSVLLYKNDINALTGKNKATSMRICCDLQLFNITDVSSLSSY